MSDAVWQANQGHPSLKLLLLHVESELEGKEATAVARHVKDCWACRTQCERLQQGIFNFMGFYESAALPPPPASRHHFSRRLREQEAERPQGNLTRSLLSSLHGLHEVLSLQALVAGGVSLALLLSLLLLWVRPSQSVAAARFLEHARKASRDMKLARLAGPSRVVYQKVQIRRGAVVLQRALYHADGAPSTTPAEAPSSPDPEMKRALDLAHVDWQDPLNADDFAAWRDTQSEKRDQVTETSDRVTLRTTISDGAPVREASLTVARSDWHPIARRAEFRDQPPLEITEMAFEVRKLNLEPPVTALAPPAKPAIEPKPAPAVELKPSQRDLDESELRLREVFHSVGADVRETPEIWTRDQRVYFRVFPDTPDRKEEILQAAEGIPLVREAGTERESSASVPAASDQPERVTAPYATTPPLAKALRDRQGGLDAANNFMDAVRDGYFQLLAESAALERLGKRFPKETLDSLPPDVQARVGRIAADHIAKIESSAAQYFELLSPVLDDMMRSRNLAASAMDADSVPCSSWQAEVGLMSADLQRLQKAFVRLFVQEQVEQPIELSAEALLAESDQVRGSLRKHLRGLCAK